MTDNSKRTGAAIEARYRFLAWLVPTIEKFPKSHKFTIGDRTQLAAAPFVSCWHLADVAVLSVNVCLSG
jgi:hypothetical protein